MIKWYNEIKIYKNITTLKIKGPLKYIKRPLKIYKNKITLLIEW